MKIELALPYYWKYDALPNDQPLHVNIKAEYKS